MTIVTVEIALELVGGSALIIVGRRRSGRAAISDPNTRLATLLVGIATLLHAAHRVPQFPPLARLMLSAGGAVCALVGLAVTESDNDSDRSS